MRFRVVSTVDTGLGPKKNPFSVWEMVDGEEVWTLQHIKSKEMGYQYIGGTTVYPYSVQVNCCGI